MFAAGTGWGGGVVNKWTDTDNCHYYLITINVLYCRRLDKCLISTPFQLPPQVISKQMWTKTKHCYSKLLTPPPPTPTHLPPTPFFSPLSHPEVTLHSWSKVKSPKQNNFPFKIYNRPIHNKLTLMPIPNKLMHNYKHAICQADHASLDKFIHPLVM